MVWSMDVLLGAGCTFFVCLLYDIFQLPRKDETYFADYRIIVVARIPPVPDMIFYKIHQR